MLNWRKSRAHWRGLVRGSRREGLVTVREGHFLPLCARVWGGSAGSIPRQDSTQWSERHTSHSPETDCQQVVHVETLFIPEHHYFILIPNLIKCRFFNFWIAQVLLHWTKEASSCSQQVPVNVESVFYFYKLWQPYCSDISRSTAMKKVQTVHE